MARYRALVDGPRWEPLERRIKDLAWEFDLEVKLATDRGWLRKTVRFEISGTNAAVRRFIERFGALIAEMNGDRE